MSQPAGWGAGLERNILQQPANISIAPDTQVFLSPLSSLQQSLNLESRGRGGRGGVVVVVVGGIVMQCQVLLS